MISNFGRKSVFQLWRSNVITDLRGLAEMRVFSFGGKCVFWFDGKRVFGFAENIFWVLGGGKAFFRFLRENIFFGFGGKTYFRVLEE